MARGIIAAKPSSGTTAGKIMVTNGAIGTSSGGSVSGGTGDTTDSNGGAIEGSIGGPVTAPAPLPVGASVSYTQTISANLGDIVDFNVGTDGSATGITVYKAGKYITGEFNGNITVNEGDSVFISAHIDGKILVNGGMLTLSDKSHVEGKIESSVDGSYVFLSGTHVEGRVAVAGASYLDIQTSAVEGAVFSDGNLYSAVMNTTVKGKIEATDAKSLIIKNTTVDGKVSSTGGAYTSVTGSIIKGKLEVLNVTKCQCSGNRVDGKTNTPGCTV
jgi:hypothetical protein